MHIKKLLPMIFLVGVTVAAPTDDPVRVDLPVYGLPKQNSEPDSVGAADLPVYGLPKQNSEPNSVGADLPVYGPPKQNSEPNSVSADLPVYGPPKQNSEPNSVGAGFNIEARSDGNIVGNLLARKLQVATGALSQKINAISSKSGAVNIGGGLFSAPVTTLEGAIFEPEDIGSKALSFKENLQHFVAGIFQPKPLLDTIREEEKYGNHGDKFYAAGRAVVGGAAGVSNLVNSALEVPGNIIKQITRTASEKLNNLGGKLIGL